MNGRETYSLLHENPERHDKPDAELPAADIRDTSDALQATLRSLDELILHPNGSLSLYEEKIAGVHLKGWILRSPVTNTTDISLAVHSDNTRRIHYLSAWEYAPGAKQIAVDAPDSVVLPRIQEIYFFSESPDAKFTAVDFTKIDNMPMSCASANSLDQNEAASFTEVVADYGVFTLYSLYKVNKLLEVLRIGDELA
ncbi:hypothetical protein H0X10_02780 [Candidatus Saccharibacteria bacterium]|nr:hypothetical protein [Candidatus Saccharibacteria bacterium]